MGVSSSADAFTGPTNQLRGDTLVEGIEQIHNTEKLRKTLLQLGVRFCHSFPVILLSQDMPRF